MTTFEDYLYAKFEDDKPVRDPDDDPDTFPEWVSELDVKLLCAYADMYSASRELAAIKVAMEAGRLTNIRY